MKMIKKLSLLIIFVFAVNVNAFAASGFEAIINVPLGLSVGVPQGYPDALKPKGGVGFDAGVTAQLGYMIGLGKIGISILGELGYSYDSFKFYYSEKIGIAEGKVTTGLYTHSFQIGLLPKINIGAFAIGVGAGVKIPISAYAKTKIEGSLGGFGGKGSTDELKLDRSDIENIYDRNVIPYLKVTFDYSFFFNNNMAFNLGAYLGGDFGLAQKMPNGEWFGTDSFDVGLQLGLRFGPRL